MPCNTSLTWHTLLLSHAAWLLSSACWAGFLAMQQQEASIDQQQLQQQQAQRTAGPSQAERWQGPESSAQPSSGQSLDTYSTADYVQSSQQPTSSGADTGASQWDAAGTESRSQQPGPSEGQALSYDWRADEQPEQPWQWAAKQGSSQVPANGTSGSVPSSALRQRSPEAAFADGDRPQRSQAGAAQTSGPDEAVPQWRPSRRDVIEQPAPSGQVSLHAIGLCCCAVLAYAKPVCVQQQLCCVPMLDAVRQGLPACKADSPRLLPYRHRRVCQAGQLQTGLPYGRRWMPPSSLGLSLSPPRACSPSQGQSRSSSSTAAASGLPTASGKLGRASCECLLRHRQQGLAA